MSFARLPVDRVATHVATMSAHEAFCSIIQFCADFDRLESVSIGVALFLVPDGTVEVRMVETSDVVCRRFPHVSDDRRLC